MKIVKIVITAILLNAVFGYAQSIEVLSTQIDEFPLIKSKIFIFNEDVYPDYSVGQNQILVNDKGLIVNIEDFNCEQGEIQDSLRIVIAIDKALNRDSINGISNFDIGMQMYNALINVVDTSHTKIIITSFDYDSYMLTDLTDIKDSLKIYSNEIGNRSSSFLYPGLDDEPLGINNILSYYDDINCGIIITDGNQKAGLDSISVKFAENGIKLFPLQINSSASGKLKKISNETNGYYFDKITKNTNKQSLAKIVYSFAKGYQPCEISWLSEISCTDSSEIKISVPSMSVSKSFYYIFEADNKPAIVTEPLDLGFTLTKKVEFLEKDIAITAKNSDIYISDMFLNDERFEIVSGYDSDFILPQNQFKVLRVRYTPTDTGTIIDSAIVFTKLIIESDACSGKEVFVTGGYPNKPPITKTIEVTNPKCGETLLVGDTIDVEWIGLLRKDIVQIEYSTDGGTTWLNLAYNTDSLKFEWVVPDEVSENCLIRVIQMWPNNVGKTLDLNHAGPVHSGFFNNDGSMVITASSDMTAVIWNSNNGQKIRTLYGHTAPVVYAVFDPLERYAATASRDSSAKIWDITTGDILHNLNAHTNNVNSVNFSHDGNYLVSAASDGDVIIWNVESGAQVKKLDVYSGNSGRAWFASFSPDDQYILTAGNDGVAKMINWQTDETVKTFDTRNATQNGDAIHAIFNHDASKVSVVSSFDPKRALVWEINGDKNYTVDDTLFTLSHNPDSTTNFVINSTSFFYDGIREYILTSGSDNLAKKWDANTGEPVDPHIFKEHTNYVETAVFNFDARRVLTASLDKTAKIWNLDQRDLQIDTTDCEFAIAYADAQPIDISLGDIPYGTSTDQYVYPIENLAKFDYNVSSARITDDINNSFMFIKENVSPFVIDSLDSHKFEFRFEAKELGTSECKIEFVIPGKTITANVSANSVIKDLSEYTDLVNFGKVDLGELKDTTFSIILTNTSSNNVVIDSIYLKGYSTTEFNYFGIDELPLTLSSSENLPIQLRFSPKTLGLKNAQLVFEHNGKYSPSQVNLFGISDIMVRDSLTLTIDDASGAPGDIIDIPIRIKVAKDKPVPSGIEGFETELYFNSTLLEPIGNFKKDIIINDYTRCITFDMDVNDLNGDIIKTLQFKVGLGNDSLSKLDLKYSYPVGKSNVSLLEEDGTFRLTGFCNSDNPRLFDPYGRSALEQNTPNPAQSITTIKFDILEPGNTKIEITDMLGKLSKVVLDKFMLPGTYEITVNTEEMPSGSYIYTLKTPNRILNRRMEIRK